MKRMCLLWAMSMGLTFLPARGEELTVDAVRSMIRDWSADFAAFRFDAMAMYFADDATVTLTHPVKRNVMEMTKAGYIESVRPLAQTWTGMVLVVDSVDVRIAGGTATAIMLGHQTVQGVDTSVTRGGRTTLDVQIRDGQPRIVRAEIIPEENAEYRRFRNPATPGPFR